MKVTGSMRKALEIFAYLVEGRVEEFAKPWWGWQDVHFINPSHVKDETETMQEDGGHGKIDNVEVPTGVKTRNVSFWMDGEHHLATIYLRNENGTDIGWKVDSITTNQCPQLGGPAK